MELTHVEQDGNAFIFRFEKKEEEKIERKVIRFECNHTMSSSFLKGQLREFPYELNSDLKTIPLHIRYDEPREIFRECMEYVAKTKKMPMHVSFANHPAYPLTLFTFNEGVMPQNIADDLIDGLMDAIVSAVIETETVERETEEKEKETETDEDVILEYEEDEELKAIMKQPAKETILPIEERDND